MAHIKTGRNQLQTAKTQTVDHVVNRVNDLVKNNVPQGNVQQTEADHHQPHDGTGTEGDLQTAVQTFTGAPGSTAAGGSCRLHADETAETGEETACKEGNRHKGVLETVKRKGQEDHKENHEHDPDRLVLLTEVCHGAFTDEARDLLHRVVAFRRLDHEFVTDQGEDQCHKSTDRGDPECFRDSGCDR